MSTRDGAREENMLNALRAGASRTQTEREHDLQVGRELERKDAEIARLRTALKQIMSLADKAQPTENVLIRIGHIADEAISHHEQQTNT